MPFGVRATADRPSTKSVPTGSSALIVDDSQTMRIMLRDMLMRIGIRSIDDASDVAGAISHLQKRSYSVIISAWHMEPLNGLELLREVRRISRPGQNRFIFSTSERSWGTKASAKLEGAEAFLVKPFTIEEAREQLLSF